jgi:hypothetical protein
MKKLFMGISLGFLMLIQVSGQDAAITGSITSLVNSARNQAGISSLLISIELTSAAQRHSNDMANTGILNHVGTDGSQFWERMVASGYSLTTGAENILLRSDANTQAVFNQWWNSPPHQVNMMNPDYVEIGVAYAQSADGTYYFTMVLGARVGVSVPPIASSTPYPPTFTPLPPTVTPVPPTFTFTPLPSATFTATPLIPPTRTLSPLITPVYFTPLPTITATPQPIATSVLPPDIRLVYDADSFTLLNVSRDWLDLTGITFQSDSGELDAIVWDTEFLTEPLNNFSHGDCLQVWGLDESLLQDKISDCNIRHSWVAVNDSQLFWNNVRLFFVLNDGDFVGQCNIAEGFCDISLQAELQVIPIVPSLLTPNNRDVRLIFNQDSVTVLSIADTPINLRGLVFQSSSGTLNIEAWNTEFMTSSLNGLPPNDCLMVWTFGMGEQLTPNECETRHGWIMVGDDADFWREVSRFDVIRDNRILAGCVVANGFCDVNLAGNLGVDSPTLVPSNPLPPVETPLANDSSSVAITSSDNDLTFVYNLDSFTLINTSGRSLDLSGIVFESDNGVFSANRWNTEFLSRPLNEFPSGDCLQVWGVNEEFQAKPSGCATRHGWVAVASDVQFWRNTTQLRVRYGAQSLGVCDLRAEHCAINLP